MVFIVLGFAALSVDMGYRAMVQVQLQHTTDAAALAATQYLDGTAGGEAAARSMATHVAQRNRVNGRPLVLDGNEANLSDGDVVLGTWDPAGGFTASADVTEANTVRVNGFAEMDTLFARVAFGRDELGVRSTSIAQKPPAVAAGKVSCYLPLAVPDCMLDTYTAAELQALTLVLNPAGLDTVGWGRGGASPNANWTRDQLYDCDASGQVGVGDLVGLQNGTATSALPDVDTLIEASSTAWDTDRWGALPAQQLHSAVSAANYGNTLEGVMLLFDGGPDYCTSGGAYNGYETITGFVWGAVYDVITTGPVATRNIHVRLDLSEQRVLGEGSGGLDAGILYQAPVQLLQ